MLKKLFVLLAALFTCATCFAAEADEPVEKTPGCNPDLMDMVFILDRSGSMSGLERDTIGGFNSLITKQKAQEGGEVCVSCVLFNHESKLLYNRVSLADIKAMTDKDYTVGGSTALLDAVGIEMNRLDRVYTELGDKRPGKVLFVIITDGEENSSREFTQPKIKEMISERMEKRGWEFLFLGANIDAVSVAGNYGISARHAATYRNDSRGVAQNFAALEAAASDMRANGKVSEDWADGVKEDYQGKR